ncbi:MAG: PP2C family protein-serine/threonine phosphatase [Terriglobia bacterium]
MPASRRGRTAARGARSPRRTSARREEEQLQQARKIQETLLPPPLTALPGVNVAARFLPSSAVGGDFYDYFTLDDRFLVIYLGDVQGKGLEAAMYGLLVSGLMRGLHKTGTNPADVITFLNHRLCYRALPGKFCCLNYAAFDLVQRRLLLANAGMPFPFLLRQGKLSRLELGGVPVGIFNPCAYEQLAVDLQPGDRLLLHTDGVPDSLEGLRPARGDGEEQLKAFLQARAHASASGLADGLAHFLQPAAKPAPGRSSTALRRKRRRSGELQDDATFLVVHLL